MSLFNAAETARRIRNRQTVTEKRYKSINVAMFHWEEDDVGVRYEVHDLSAVFKDIYHFASVETHVIPSHNPYKFVERTLDNLKRGNSHKDNLLIVYYSGHGSLDNGKLMWSAYSSRKYPRTPVPTVEWWALQVGLERADSDVLILLDTCCSGAALKSSSSREGGVTEVIGACDFDATTPGTGNLTFTSVLTSELRELARLDETFSALDLHGKMRAHIQRKARAAEDMQTSNLSSAAPIYDRLNGGPREPNIILRAFASSSENIAAEVHRYKKRLFKEVLQRWEKSIPAKVRKELLAPKEPEPTYDPFLDTINPELGPDDDFSPARRPLQGFGWHFPDPNNISRRTE